MQSERDNVIQIEPTADGPNMLLGEYQQRLLVSHADKGNKHPRINLASS